MRRATERINRKSRSIIKYIDNTDTLKIEVESKPTKGLKPAENLTNWEDMFDEEGELKEIYLEEVRYVLDSCSIVPLFSYADREAGRQRGDNNQNQRRLLTISKQQSPGRLRTRNRALQLPLLLKNL